MVGLGAIGAMVADVGLKLGMKVIGYDPYLSVESAWELSNNIEKATGLETLLSDADYVSIHVPLLDSTKNMFNREKFAMMKDGIKIMNFARGGLVDEEDLKDALKAGKVSCYVTDFPHDGIGSKGNYSNPTSRCIDNRIGRKLCNKWRSNQIKDYLENGNITNSVNFPNCVLPRGCMSVTE